MPKTLRKSERQRRQANTLAHRVARANAPPAAPPIQLPVSFGSISQPNASLVQYSDQMKTAARKFEDTIAGIVMRTCSNCLRSSPDLKLDRSDQ